ncbi:SMP-30/gluconolactonase/LRE family protein [Aliagarivorans taiwanensis]|uniref:SMP-30/gluconolactonase/LRE family protein n=1 Tax=Aliagarivorans taiwanensis TaxID=561966 RepID=UPI00047A2073|nr:SMP-30/gluconolactonase/LRE family protein [Aliagarivorans taiwanensis]
MSTHIHAGFQFSALSPASNLLGEGPVWLPSEQAIYWVDIIGKTLNYYQPSSQRCQSCPQPNMLSAVLPCEPAGQLVGFYEDGIYLIRDGQRDAEPLLELLSDNPDMRCNDAWVAPTGDIWFGTMDKECARESGNFYRLTPKLELQAMPGSYVVTNGPTFDGDNAFFVDTEQRQILRGQLDAQGHVVQLNQWVEFSEEQGHPDGIAIDAEHHLWVGHWGGARLSRYRPDGSLEREIPIPALNVTKCAFGGSKLDTLFITTARNGMSEQQLAEYPLSGSLLALKLDDVRGVACPAFSLAEHVAS